MNLCVSKAKPRVSKENNREKSMCRVVQCSEIARSGNDRYIQRQIADKAIAEVKRLTGKDITNADFQALMW